MTSSISEIGTLIVVILKARNLPNKRHLGKQAPYCAVKFNGETRRTKVIKRGGQHPEWDEEIRFTLYEDDALAPRGDDVTPPPLPPKDGKAVRKVQGGEIMHLSCFADDPKEPDLIGDTVVDLREVLTNGETDEWFTLTHKDRYCGEVYLELTFWSNAPPPQRKQAPASQKTTREYGGSGEFTPSTDDSGDEYSHSRHSSYMETIRPSNSSAKVNLYMPSYEPRAGSRSASVDRLVNDFGELGVGDHARRSSTYPPPNDFNGTVNSAMSGQSSHSDQGVGYGTVYRANGTIDSNHTQRPHRMSDASGLLNLYQAPYEQQPTPVASSFSSLPPRRPRYSMPASSSGFVPVPSQTELPGFPRGSHSPEPSTISSHSSSRMSIGGYTPPPSRSPAPPSRGPRHSHTPAPSSSFSTLPMPHQPQLVPSATTPANMHQLQLPFPPQSVIGTLPPSSAPPLPGQFPPGAPNLSLVPHSAPPPPPPLPFRGTTTPPHTMTPPVIPTHVPGSRPLPQPQGVPQMVPQLPAPPPGSQLYLPAPPTEGGHQRHPTPPSHSGPTPVPTSSFDLIPPPPPLPSSSTALVLSKPPPPPPTVPPQIGHGHRVVSGRPSQPLPTPPGPAAQPSAYESLPLPPPPPLPPTSTSTSSTSTIPPPPPLPSRRTSSAYAQAQAQIADRATPLPVHPHPHATQSYSHAHAPFLPGQTMVQVGPPPRPPAQLLALQQNQWGPATVEH